MNKSTGNFNIIGRVDGLNLFTKDVKSQNKIK